MVLAPEHVLGRHLRVRRRALLDGDARLHGRCAAVPAARPLPRAAVADEAHPSRDRCRRGAGRAADARARLRAERRSLPAIGRLGHHALLSRARLQRLRTRVGRYGPWLVAEDVPAAASARTSSPGTPREDEHDRAARDRRGGGGTPGAVCKHRRRRSRPTAAALTESERAEGRGRGSRSSRGARAATPAAASRRRRRDGASGGSMRTRRSPSPPCGTGGRSRRHRQRRRARRRPPRGGQGRRRRTCAGARSAGSRRRPGQAHVARVDRDGRHPVPLAHDGVRAGEGGQRRPLDVAERRHPRGCGPERLEPVAQVGVVAVEDDRHAEQGPEDEIVEAARSG